MRNVVMLAATVFLCACLLGGAGCDRWDWPPGSRNDQPGPDDQPAVAQETPEQKTIRTQGETIDALQVENEQLKDDIVELANAIVGFQEDIEGLEFALDKQNESLDDALEQRSRQQLHAGELADENRRLEERMQVLAGQNEQLQALLDELHGKYERLLDSVSGELSDDDEDEDDDADAGDDADADDDDADEGRSRIDFND